jgi:hypothetical protein
MMALQVNSPELILGAFTVGVLRRCFGSRFDAAKRISNRVFNLFRTCEIQAPLHPRLHLCSVLFYFCIYKL